MNDIEHVTELLGAFEKLEEKMAAKKAELDAAQAEVARAVEAADAVEKEFQLIEKEVESAAKYCAVIKALMSKLDQAAGNFDAEYKELEFTAFRSFAAEVGLPDEDRDRYEKTRGIAPEKPEDVEIEVEYEEDIAMASAELQAVAS